MAGRARAAAHYPAKCCKALCKGMRRQAKVDASGLMSTLINELQDEVGDATHVPDAWMKFWMTLARRQIEGGRYFIYEHPKSAASWQNPDV